MDANTYEATLEDMVISNISFCQTRGFPDVYTNTSRQFQLPTGKRCDIFSYELIDDTLNCKIFELKRGKIDLAGLLQVIEYGVDVAKYSVWDLNKINIELYLVGSDINNELFNICAWGVNVNIITFEYKVDGIHFDTWKSLGVTHPPYWVKAPIEMMSKPSDVDINNWVLKLKNQLKKASKSTKDDI
jgi:hypothetical protein